MQRGSGRTDKNSVAANTHLMNLEVDAALNRILSEQNRLSELSPAKVSTREVEENNLAGLGPNSDLFGKIGPKKV